VIGGLADSGGVVQVFDVCWPDFIDSSTKASPVAAAILDRLYIVYLRNVSSWDMSAYVAAFLSVTVAPIVANRSAMAAFERTLKS
jgi:hypothetical protein